MNNWKEFKNWLEKNIVENEGWLIKIRPEKQEEYGKLSVITLTSFFDSLEATLDNNQTHHLLPWLSKYKSFREIIPPRTSRFGKKTDWEIVSESDYNLLERLFIDWKIEINRVEKIREEEEKEKGKCQAEDCSESMILPSIYCFEHTCQTKNCLKLRMSKENEEVEIYCWNHFQQSMEENQEEETKTESDEELSKFEHVKKVNQKLEKNNKSLQIQLNQLIREKMELESKVKELEIETEIASLKETELAELKKTQAEKEEEVKQIREEREKHEIKVEQEKSETEKVIKRWENDYILLKKETNKTISELKLTKETTENIFSSREATIKSNQLIINNLKTSLENKKKEIEKLTSELKNYQDEKSDLQKQIKQLQNEALLLKKDCVKKLTSEEILQEVSRRMNCYEKKEEDLTDKNSNITYSEEEASVSKQLTGIEIVQSDKPTQEQEEIAKWDDMKTNLEVEKDIDSLANGGYWDKKIQTLQNDKLPADKKQITLQTQRWNWFKQLKGKEEKRFQTQIEVLSKK